MALEVGQLDGPALLGRKVGQGARDLVGQREVPHLMGMSYSAAAVRRASFASRRPAGVERADGVDGTGVGLGQQERAQGAPCRVEAVGLVPEAQEHLLGHVLGLGGAVEDAPGQAVDGAAVPAVHLGQRHLAVAGDGVTSCASLTSPIFSMHFLFGVSVAGCVT